MFIDTFMAGSRVSSSFYWCDWWYPSVIISYDKFSASSDQQIISWIVVKWYCLHRRSINWFMHFVWDCICKLYFGFDEFIIYLALLLNEILILLLSGLTYSGQNWHEWAWWGFWWLPSTSCISFICATWSFCLFFIT